jgi:plasmid stability protein
MAQLIVRSLEDSVRDKLKERAQSHGRSMEEEVRDILRAAVVEPVQGDSEKGLGTQIAELFAGVEVMGDEPFVVETWRGGVPKPASFDP